MPLDRRTTRRARLVLSLIEYAVLIFSLLTIGATSAFAGSISGRVTRSSDGSGIQGTVVHVIDENNDDVDAATATTDANGYYTATVPDGTYFVYTQDIHGYINKIYPNVSCSASCDLSTVVPVVVAGAVTGIDFVLDLGGRISGTVTSTATGLPIAGIRVFFVSGVAGQDQIAFTSGITDVNGHYTSDGGTIAGNVYALTDNSLGFQNEAYDNVKCFNCDVQVVGTLIPVTGAGTTTTGIDFALDPGGNVSGTVTDTGGHPLANIEVNLRDSTGSKLASALTDGLGHYTTAGLPDGNYYASTRNRFGYADLLYSNVACYGGNCNPTQGATVIPLTVGSTTSGINFALPVGGLVTGTVMAAAGGAPLEDLFVGIFATGTGTFLGGGGTNSSGVFKITAPAGSYTLAVINAAGYANQLYSGLPCPSLPFCPTGGGTPVLVTTGLTTSNINFALVAGVGGGITGTVTSAVSGALLNGIQVQVLTPSGTVVGTATTNGGVYVFFGLAPGSYYVRTSGNANFINLLYRGVVCINCTITTAGGTLISVATGVMTTNINFDLTEGGRIMGTVTNAATAAVLQSVPVQFYSSTGISLGQVNTNASGVYNSPALPPGNYFVRTAVTSTQNFIDEVYINKACVPCPVMAGDAVAVAGTATTSNINFALDGGGAISGTVTGAGGAPVAAMSVLVIDTNGVVVKTVTTDASGNYSVAGLPTGTYLVRTNPNGAMQNYVTQVYNGIAFDGIPNVFTPVGVTVGSTHGGVNFSLASGGSLSGTVTGDGGAALGSVAVSAYSASTGRIVKSSTTDAFGLYVITGLQAGTYYVATAAPSTQTPYYLDELYDNLPCLGCINFNFTVVTLPCAPACTPSVTSATPVDVTEGAAHAGVNFSLTSGAGVITGSVRDAGGIGLTNVTVAIFNGAGALVRSAVTAANSGSYTARGLAPGTYYARTLVSPATPFAQDAAYGGAVCAPCDVTTTSSPIVVAANATTVADFSLAPGGAISGVVTDATTANPLALAHVQLYTAAGTLVKTTFTSSLGTFTFDGLPAGSYRARTAVTGSLAGYGDQLFTGISCVTSCTVTSGTAIDVTIGVTTGGINFPLTAKPTIAPMANVVTPLNTPVTVPLTVGSAAGAAGLMLTGSSSNTALVPNTNLIFGGSGANRTVMVTPAFGQLGATTITVTATDGTGSTSRTFAFSVAAARLDGNGDGRSDILWHNTSSGHPITWFMNGTTVVGGTNIGPVDTAWQIVGRGDFNGDARADLLWRHSSGALYAWFMDGETILGSAAYGAPELAWQIVGLADYNGDGKTDILWRHSSGVVFIWFMDGATILGSAAPGTVDLAWQIAGSGDYNADGHADILWRHSSSGLVAIWLMQGGVIIGGGNVSTVDLAYQIVGTGDFNGDGRSDILWRLTSGTVFIWEMDGLQVIGGGEVSTVDPAWQIVGTGDYDGDGRSDLLWRHSVGDTVIWLMNGATLVGGGQVAVVDPVWQIINLR